jgi:hypothetical protein
MKPSFALNFTDEAIAVLHRTSRGWMEVGSVALDDPDMGAALAYLRGSALGLEPRGVTTKLVIPNSQIRYMTLTAAGPDAASRRAQIRAELQGKTPYAVDELVFDWWGKGPSVQVAVVARETLAEAEAFATANRLNPLSFVAIPDAGQFGAEPWFGPTALAESLLAPGEKVDRDQDPIQIAGRLPPVDLPVEAAPAPDGDPAWAPVDDPGPPPAEETAAPAEAGEAAASMPLEGADDALDAEVTDTDAQTGSGPTPDPTLGTAAAETIAAAGPQSPARDPAEERPAAPEVTADSIPEETPAALRTERTSRITPTMPAAEAAALRVVTDPRLGKKAVPPPRAGAKAAAAKGPDAPRLGAAGPARPPSLPSGGAERGAKLAVPDTDWPLERVAAAARTGQGRDDPARTGPIITAPGIPMPRDRKLSVGQKPDADAGQGKTRARAEANPALTTFGKPQGQRGKPRFLGLILTGILLLLLAAVAAWSSYLIASSFGDDEPSVEVAAVDAAAGDAILAVPLSATVPAGTAEVEAAQTEAAAAEAGQTDRPAAPDAMLADLQDPAEPAPAPEPEAGSGAPAASLTGTDAIAPEAGAEPAVEAATVPQPVTTAIDGRNPGAEPQDEILLAMIDPDIPTSDAVALAEPGTATDPAPPSQPAPPPFGTLYQFDADGRIVPTPEGIITPEGVLLVAGPPPRIPPPRPAAAQAQPEAEAAAVAVTPEMAAAADPEPVVFADPALANARPRLRPADLVPPEIVAPEDGAELSTAPSGRLSSLKPRARPPELLAAGEAALQAETAAVQAAAASLVASADNGGGSPLAVAVSRKPAARPAQPNAAIEAAVSVAAADASLVPDTATLSPLVVPAAKPAVPAPEPQPVLAAKPDADDPEAVEIDEPEIASAAPSIPTRASVAKQATYKNSINLSKVNLIGVYGTSSNRYAMVRQANGRFVKVEVGDRVDGGRVAAISERALRYVKNGTTLTLEMPKG